jgi:hypothetical protein
MPITRFGIGTTTTTIALSGLTTPVPDPKAPFMYYAETATMASSKVVGRGLPIIVWQWDYLTRAQRDMLRTYCSGASSTVYIDTQRNDNADEYKQYKATMVWPKTDDRDASRRISFKIEFIACEIQ